MRCCASPGVTKESEIVNVSREEPTLDVPEAKLLSMTRTTELHDNFEEFLDLQLRRLKRDLLLCHAQEVSTAREDLERQHDLSPDLDEEKICPKRMGSPVDRSPSQSKKVDFDVQEYNAGEPNSVTKGTFLEGAPTEDEGLTPYQMSTKTLQSPWRSWVSEVIEKSEKSMAHQYRDMLEDFRNRHGMRHTHTLDRCLFRIIDSLWFAILSMSLIILNAAWIGYECNYVFEPHVDWHSTVNMVFCSVFLFELVLKMIVWRRQFFVGPDFAWNLFDAFVVLTSIPEFFGTAFHTTYLRLLRLTKLSRIFRMARLIKFFSSMHEILLTIFYTLGSLCWVLVALLGASYCFALLILQMIGSHIQEGGDLSPHTLEGFESTQRALLTLFSFITGGQEWYEIYIDLRQQQAYFAMYSLLLYIFFTLFGFFNVVTGVFCARANEASLECDDLRVAADEKKRAKQIHDLLQIFKLIDVDHCGTISWKQFQTFARSSEGMHMLHSQGLQLFDVDKIWRAMDSYDGNLDDVVDKPSFIMGIMRLSPEAVSTSLFSLVVQVDALHDYIQSSLGRLEGAGCLHQSRIAAVSPPAPPRDTSNLRSELFE